MEAHYFDIETYSAGDKPNSKEDKIITIQFLKFDLETGKPIGKLQILKEYEQSEEEIVKFIYKWFFSRNPWQFIPVGFNLNFEWEFLCEKFKQYNIIDMPLGEFYNKYPQIDLKSLAVIKENGFIGAKLSSISQKEDDGNVIKQYYEDKDFKKIEEYILKETKAFLKLYKKVKILTKNL